MKQSFYRYLMTQRDPNNYEPVPQFANNAFFLTNLSLNKAAIMKH